MLRFAAHFVVDTLAAAFFFGIGYHWGRQDRRKK